MIIAVRALLSRLRPSSEDDGEDSETTRVWDFIPAWQYDGWQSPTGGHTVDEQEGALREMRERAEGLDEAERDGR